ncbi:protein of unknown function [Methylorubrum extorquens]|uniref:Uncharacterized protein n=1 Tax=Methylorubrum extorquens TaxID=408 RepID=A0A2N9AM10_METEX|nr:protein of unknown function [Methylorubrum extorquens]
MSSSEWRNITTLSDDHRSKWPIQSCSFTSATRRSISARRRSGTLRSKAAATCSDSTSSIQVKATWYSAQRPETETDISSVSMRSKIQSRSEARRSTTSSGCSGRSLSSMRLSWVMAIQVVGPVERLDRVGGQSRAVTGVEATHVDLRPAEGFNPDFAAPGFGSTFPPGRINFESFIARAPRGLQSVAPASAVGNAAIHRCFLCKEIRIRAFPRG